MVVYAQGVTIAEIVVLSIKNIQINRVFNS